MLEGLLQGRTEEICIIPSGALLLPQIVNSSNVLGMTLLMHFMQSTLPPRASVKGVLQLLQALNVARVDSLWDALVAYVAPMMASLSLHEVTDLSLIAIC